jgi:hypothetical protein
VCIHDFQQDVVEELTMRISWKFRSAAMLGLGYAASGFAADKSWNAGNGSWGQAGNWTPAGIPGSADTVRIGNLPGVQDSVVLGTGATWIPAAIEISDGMTLDTGGVEFVGSPFPVTITGADSRLIIRPHAGGNLRDFIGQLDIGVGAHLELVDNVPIHQFVGAFTSWGHISGVGDILVESPTPFRNEGVINPGGASGLKITQHWSGDETTDLDGASGSGQIWFTIPFSILEINAGGLTDPFGGVINMVSGSLLTMNMDDGWPVDGTITVNGSGIANAAALIDGDDLTLSGTINVAGDEGILRVLTDTVIEPPANVSVFTEDRLELDGATTVNGGNFHLYDGATLDFDGATTMRGGEFITPSADPADGVVNFNAPSTTWNGSEGPVEINGVARQMGNAFVNGPTVINAEVFDMDGEGDTLWTVWNDLTINAVMTQPGVVDDTFTGTLNIAGAAGKLTVDIEPEFANFHMHGEMNLIGHPAVYHTRYAGDALRLFGALNVSGKVAVSAHVWAYDGALTIADANATLRLDGGSIIGLDCAISGEGEIRVGPDATLSALFPHANFGGVGLLNDGRMGVPGFADVDRFQQTANGSWQVFLRGYDAEDNDQLRVTGGDAALDGELKVKLFNFQPVVGDEFTILTVTGGLSGTFDQNPSTIYQGHRYEWSVLYVRQAVRLRLAAIHDCPLGDLDNDGDIDLTDLAILLTHFGTPGGADWNDGDIDQDDDVDLADLAILLTNYGLSCT